MLTHEQWFKEPEPNPGNHQVMEKIIGEMLRGIAIRQQENLYTTACRSHQGIGNPFTGFIFLKNVDLQVYKILCPVDQLLEQMKIGFSAPYELYGIVFGISRDHPVSSS